jgi:hypothetical protein
MIILLGGDSWVDRSSFFATYDLLNSIDIVSRIGNVQIVDLDSKDGYKLLKDSLKVAKLLTICGGKPIALMNALGKNGKTVIRHWLAAAPEQHLFLGICAGVAAAAALGFSQIKLFNDESWRLCGISMDVVVEFSSAESYQFCYESGPLMILQPTGNPVVMGRYATDVVYEQSQKVKSIPCERDQWVCYCCTFINPMNQGKCGFCSESKNYQLPPKNEMVGKFAVLLFPQYFLCSVHPELSGNEAKEFFRSLFTRFCT